KPEPYFAEPFAKLQRALAKARLIVLTHHHADHVAGVLCAPNFSELAAKTIITRQVADCMRNTPHRPHLKLAPPALERFIILDYPQYYPVAPGVVGQGGRAGSDGAIALAQGRRRDGKEHHDSRDPR